jgi:hypothetical protein
MNPKYKRLPSKTRAFLDTFVSSLKGPQTPQLAEKPAVLKGLEFTRTIKASNSTRLSPLRDVFIGGKQPK